MSCYLRDLPVEEQKDEMLRILRLYGGLVRETAAHLGMSKTGFYRYLDQLDLARDMHALSEARRCRFRLVA